MTEFYRGHYLSVEDAREAWYVRKGKLVVSLQALLFSGDVAETMLKRPYLTGTEGNDKTLSVAPIDGGVRMFSDFGRHWKTKRSGYLKTRDCPLWPRGGCWYDGSSLQSMYIAYQWREHDWSEDWLYANLAEAWEILQVEDLG